jgi:uncharacterized lipoprotein YehR (DUF1307 family)
VRPKQQVDEFNFAVAKPTVDEILTQANAVNRTGKDFLKLDVETALTFTSIALQTKDAARKQRNRQSARRAYDTVMRFLERVSLSDQEAEGLAVKLDRLKADLKTLGEVF